MLPFTLTNIIVVLRTHRITFPKIPWSRAWPSPLHPWSFPFNLVIFLSTLAIFFVIIPFVVWEIFISYLILLFVLQRILPTIFWFWVWTSPALLIFVIIRLMFLFILSQLSVVFACISNWLRARPFPTSERGFTFSRKILPSGFNTLPLNSTFTSGPGPIPCP